MRQTDIQKEKQTEGEEMYTNRERQSRQTGRQRGTKCRERRGKKERHSKTSPLTFSSILRRFYLTSDLCYDLLHV